MRETRAYIPIRFRVVRDLSVFILLPVVILSVIASLTAFAVVRTQLAERLQADLNVVSDQIDDSLQTIQETYRLVLVELDRFSSRVRSGDQLTQSLVVREFAETRQAIRQFRTLTPELVIRVFPDPSTAFPVDGALTYPPSAVVDPVPVNPNQIVWSFTQTLPGSVRPDGESWIAYVGLIRSLSLFEREGVVVVASRFGGLARRISSVIRDTGGSAWLELPGGDVIEVAEDGDFWQLLESDVSSRTRRGDISVALRMSEPDWFLRVAVDRGSINRQTLAFLFPALLTIILIGVVVVAFGWIWSGRFGARLTRIAGQLATMGDPALPAPIATLSPPADEIDLLVDRYNSVARDVRRLIREVYEKETQRTAAELDALQAHVGPHLIVNALEAVRSCATSGDAATAGELIELISTFVRRVVTRAPRTTVADEVAIACDFVAISSRLFGKAVKVHTSICSDAAEMPVLRLVLQPIVENSLEHGFVGRGSGTVVIRARNTADGLLLIVEDDGTGISEPDLDRIRASLAEDDATPGRHYGLWNVHRRLKVEYGDASGLELRASETGGACVTLRVPAGGISE